MDRWYFFVGALGVWRVTHLLNAEDGPWKLFAKLRKFMGSGFWGGLLDCFYCLSLWVAAPFAYWLGSDLREAWLLWPALSGAAILLERATARRQAIFVEDDEEAQGGKR